MKTTATVFAATLLVAAGTATAGQYSPQLEIPYSDAPARFIVDGETGTVVDSLRRDLINLYAEAAERVGVAAEAAERVGIAAEAAERIGIAAEAAERIGLAAEAAE